MPQKRFNDEGTYLAQFMTTILVVCPVCTDCARVSRPGPNPARLTCPHCAHTATQTTPNTYTIHPHGLDPYFNQPLWLTTTVRGHTLWAYNHDHLTFLKQLVQATLRQHTPNQNRTLSNRLPKWLLDKKNRPHVLRAINKLENRR